MKVMDLRSKLEELGETFDGSDEHNRTGSYRKKGARAAARYRKQMNGTSYVRSYSHPHPQPLVLVQKYDNLKKGGVLIVLF